MKKIIIIGCSGSGKSYFARQLRDITKLPLFYMDCIFWKENWEHLTKDELIGELQKIRKNDSWIIDGNYCSTLEERLKEADTVFFLDVSEELCIESEKLRRGTKREDLPAFLNEEYDPEFITFIKSFKTDTKPAMEELFKRYPNKEYHIFKNREEKEEYLNNLKNEYIS